MQLNKIVTIDEWYVAYHSSSKVGFTPHRHMAERFDIDTAVNIKKRVQSLCVTAFLSWKKEEVIILGVNEKIPSKQVQTTLF